MTSARRIIFILIALAGFFVRAGESSEKVSFNFQIRPVLSDRCFKCHGPDAKSRKADLRLDLAEGALARREKSGAHPVVPGQPEKSEIIRRITSSDPDEQMPPPDSNLKISVGEIALIRQWIKQGAEYKSHWAFIPLEKTPVPNTENSWVRNPIDQLVLARLSK